MPSEPAHTESDEVRAPGFQRRTAVLLPCDTEEFTNFISGLLGKPQTIERIFYEDFEIEKADIENLHYLVMQRVAQQNEANLIQFTAKVYYHDRSSVRINSFEDFMSFSEVKPLSSEAAIFTWTFLVRFIDKKFPEKQQIEVFFDARHLDRQPGIFVIMDDIVYRERYGLIKIMIRINHTARTWEQILNLCFMAKLSNVFVTVPVYADLLYGALESLAF